MGHREDFRRSFGRGAVYVCKRDYFADVKGQRVIVSVQPSYLDGDGLTRSSPPESPTTHICTYILLKSPQVRELGRTDNPEPDSVSCTDYQAVQLVVNRIGPSTGNTQLLHLISLPSSLSNAHVQSTTTPGQSTTTPGQPTTTPGQPTTTPGQSATTREEPS
ncbi:hypothetical protein BD626DRAFT_570164 [Schizophyllum amplum]|uniref:Uncharacterized protein n=1 Tax=Schizophyllum amplum TaxID=97359 RepID=A0A550CAY1_9AGAR|nr:hypothetical protein BD626DRAFT_570164 [Auriculariopsis ampla]